MSKQIPDRPLQGRVALVTGASRGIGRAIARRLASAGATVVVAARSLNRSTEYSGTLQETVDQVSADGGRAIAIAVDLEDGEQLQQLVPKVLAEAGRLDILVNNAGVAHYEPIETLSTELFEQTLDHYLRIPVKLCQAVIPVMREQGAGWIINLGSVTALRPIKPYSPFDTDGGVTLYATAKAAVNRFSQGLAAELLQDNIAVNVLAPSTAISTPGADRYIPEDYPTEDIAYIAETALALSHLPAAERTGLLAHSLHFPHATGLTVHSLDGTEVLPAPTLPPYSHPDIPAAGE